MLARNGKYRDELASGGVKVLEGYLVERGDRVDEKKVDVLLALQVADVVDRIRQGKTSAKCVVVLSEDMDLMLAYEYAAARGVQVYALADDTVYHREDQKKWLLLHEAAARGLGSEEDTQGTPVRKVTSRDRLWASAGWVCPLVGSRCGTNGPVMSSWSITRGCAGPITRRGRSCVAPRWTCTRTQSSSLRRGLTSLRWCSRSLRLRRARWMGSTKHVLLRGVNQRG